MSADDRATVLKALSAIRKGQWKNAENLVASTRDPLAAKLYYWLAYTKHANDVKFDRITGFVEQNPDWPGQSKLRLAAEKAINSNVADADIIAWFADRKPLTPDGMENYLDALSRKGDTAKLQQVVREWWKDASLSPDQQTRFLKKYGKHIDEKANRLRFDKMLLQEKYTNARAIAQVLGRGYPALAEARIVIASDGKGVDGVIARVPAHLAGDPGLLYERMRWRRRNGKLYDALEILHNPPAADMITNPEDWWKEQHIIVRDFIEKKQYESAYLVVSKHRQKEGVAFAEAEFLSGWLALRFLKQPWKAFEHFEALYHGVETPISKARGAYWAGRASDELKHPEIARQWYRVAARHQTTYYGQLALAALDDEYKPPQQLPPERTLAAQAAFNSSEMAQVARILNKAGYRKETTDFLDAMAEKTATPEDYILIADLAEELDHYHNAVRIAKKGLQKNIMMMDHAFPTMLSRMKNIPLEWALVHSIIRQESAFDYDAQSPVGARGLMQLMPATAAETAKKKGWAHQTDWLTTRPEHNIKLGSAYMDQMVKRFDGSYPLALAAYNAGPGRVDRWVKNFGDPRKGEIDIIDWVELIPISETRNYVQRVLESVYVYRMKLQGVQKSAEAPIHVAYRAPQ